MLPGAVLRDLNTAVWATMAAWSRDDAAILGAGLAYYALLSLAPLLLVVVTLLSAFLGEDVAREEVQEVIRALVGPEGARAVRGVVLSARGSGGWTATVLGGAMLVISSTRLFAQLQRVLDRVFGVAQLPGTSMARTAQGIALKRLVAFGLVLGLGLVLLGSVFVSSMLAALAQVSGLQPSERLGQLLYNLGLCGIFALGTSGIYAVLPNVRIHWRDLLPGAGVTAVMLVLGKHAIGMYLGTFGVVTTVRASGAVLGLLLWTVYSAQLFLLGAEFTKIWARSHHGMRPAPGFFLVDPAPVAVLAGGDTTRAGEYEPTEPEGS